VNKNYKIADLLIKAGDLIKEGMKLRNL
jgi:hypothetical protein